MLSCYLAVRAKRPAIPAEIAEAAVAADAITTGLLFDALVDDPASALEHLDAYSGEIMIEAASATATEFVGLNYLTAIDEEANAADTLSVYAPAILNVTMVEAASAADVVDSSKIAAVRFEGVLALNGRLITSAATQPAVIYIEG